MGEIAIPEKYTTPKIEANPPSKIAELRERLKNAKPLEVKTNKPAKVEKNEMIPLTDRQKERIENSRIMSLGDITQPVKEGPVERTQLRKDSPTWHAGESREREQSERLKNSVDIISKIAVQNYVREHGLNPRDVPNITDSIFVGLSRDQMEEALADQGFDVEGGLGPAGVMTLSKQPNQLEQIVWFDQAHPYIKNLENFNPSNFEMNQQGLLIVAEEVSHFLYKDQYYKKYGEEPPEWMSEMVGALDKYNLMQQMYTQKYGRTMNPQEEQHARSMIFTALDARSGAPEEHSVGHSYAYNLVSRMNRLASTGSGQEADALFQQVYASDANGLRGILDENRNHIG